MRFTTASIALLITATASLMAWREHARAPVLQVEEPVPPERNVNESKNTDHMERAEQPKIELEPTQVVSEEPTRSSEASGSESTVYVGGVPVQVSIADDLTERQRGLSGTSALAADAGKLFIFDIDASWGIWMKDMLFPIDIIWADQSGMITHIERSVAPETYPKSFESPVPSRYVLEVNAGFTTQHSIEVGDVIVLPPELQNSS